MSISKERLAELQEQIKAGNLPAQSFSLEVLKDDPSPHEVGKGKERPAPHEKTGVSHATRGIR